MPRASKRASVGPALGPAKRTRNPTPPPPAPSGDDNPSSYKSLQARVKELEAENAELKSKLDRPAVAERTGEDEGITASRMKKVLNQRPEADSGPLEERIREWLSKDVKGFEAAIEEKEDRVVGTAKLREENARLRGELAAVRVVDAGTDDGAAAARDLIERCLADALTSEGKP